MSLKTVFVVELLINHLMKLTQTLSMLRHWYYKSLRLRACGSKSKCSRLKVNDLLSDGSIIWTPVPR